MGMNPRGCSRGRNHNFNNNRRFNNNGFSRNTVFDSQGPAGRLRGTAYQLMEKYLAAAKDAMSTDRVLAENCLQHADHYMRLNAMAMASENQNRYPVNQPQPAAEELTESENTEEEASAEEENEEISVPEPVSVEFTETVSEEKPINLDEIAGADLSVPVAVMAENHSQQPAQRRRGRPPVQKSGREEAKEETSQSEGIPSTPRRRGRPPKHTEE